MTLKFAILLDEHRSREEASAMQRFAVALAGEGLQSVIATADSVAKENDIQHNEGPIPRIQLPVHTPFWLRSEAARLVAEQLESSLGNDALDAIVLSGLEALDIASRCAQILQCPLISEVRSREEANIVMRHNAKVHIAVAATEPIANRMALKLGSERVECIRPCLPSTTAATSPEGRFLLILGPPNDPLIWCALMDGILDATSALDEEDRPMIAMELGERRADMHVWAHARTRGMLDRIVSVDQIDSLRPLLTSAAAVIIPEGSQQLRSILPQAMQRGVVPVVAHDPDMDFLEDGVTALSVNPNDLRRPSAWGERITSVLDPAISTPLAHAAAERSNEFLASRVAPQWSTLLHSIVHGDTISLTES